MVQMPTALYYFTWVLIGKVIRGLAAGEKGHQGPYNWRKPMEAHTYSLPRVKL